MTTDFFLYDTEQLNTLAPAETVKRGLAYFTENRVFALSVEDDQLTSQVEGSLTDQPYWVELSKGSDIFPVGHDDRNGRINSTFFRFRLCALIWRHPLAKEWRTDG